jgi:hypothetical protein
MDRHEKRFLSRRSCWMCEQHLDRDVCGASPWFSCSAETMADRRRRCLETYKPRLNRRKND